MMLCSYLLYSRYLPDPFAALVFFAEKRTQNGKVDISLMHIFISATSAPLAER